MCLPSSLLCSVAPRNRTWSTTDVAMPASARNAIDLSDTIASALYAKNILNYLTPLVDSSEEDVKLSLDWEDEILAAATLTRDGKVVHAAFQTPEPTQA